MLEYEYIHTLLIVEIYRVSLKKGTFLVFVSFRF